VKHNEKKRLVITGPPMGQYYFACWRLSLSSVFCNAAGVRSANRLQSLNAVKTDILWSSSQRSHNSEISQFASVVVRHPSSGTLVCGLTVV